MEPKLEVTMDEYLPLRDVVFKTLRQAILRGELKPGERLMEIKLANKLGVSRTPIREAIRKLELEGLVLMIPRRGAEVAEITEKSLNDVRSYLTIQKMRYKDKLEYTIDVEERILDVRIIKFVLQPLVENAIYHGLKYKETKGNLDIRGYRRGNRVCLVVADDGAGMEESELEHILEKKEKKTKSNGVGVYNVQKRLQLYYGAEYGISYISRKGEGTVATVTIPLDGGKSNEDTGR